MGMSEWLLVASLGVSLFVILSQIGVIRRMNDVQEILELLVLNEILEAEVRKQKDERDK